MTRSVPCAHVGRTPSPGAHREANLTFTPGQWNLVFAAFTVAMFALLAGFAYFFSSRSELGARYRPIGTVSALVPLVAFVAYGVLALS